MIFWNGRSSDEFSLIVEKYPVRPVPERKIERVSVPGRSGDIVFPQDAFSNVNQSYDVYISAERRGLPMVIRPCLSWLCVPGYHRLEDSYDPDCYRLAMFLGGVEFANALNMFGRASISFDCQPERWLKYGEQPQHMGAAGALYNPTGMTAFPLITVHGSGAGSLTVGGTTMTLSDCNGVVLDCDSENAYRGTENMNNTVSGEFPALGAGQTDISWTGGITAVDIKPRWWSL